MVGTYNLALSTIAQLTRYSIETDTILPPLEPTCIRILSEQSVTQILEDCLLGKLCHAPRGPKPTDNCIQDQFVFVYEKNATEVDTWKDDFTQRGSGFERKEYAITIGGN